VSRSFADIDARRRRYNPEIEGYGHPRQWRGDFGERMGWEEAYRVIHEQPRTPRDILGIPLHSTWQQVVSAYRKRAMECHPDRASQNGMTVEAATEAFKNLSAAYSVLAREYGEDR
jgi:DnaJ-class molecular chaperone